MTCLISTVQGRRCYMMADRAITDEAGKLIGTMCKIIRGTAFPWAITLAGMDIFPAYRLVISVIEQRQPSEPRALAKAVIEAFQHMQDRHIDRPVQAHLGIWDRKTGSPFLATINTQTDGAADEPFRMHPRIAAVATASLSLGRWTLDDLVEPNRFDPLRDGAELIRTQRRILMENWETPAHRIGGGVEVAVVGRRGVRIETLWAWPDKLHERIDPANEGFPFDLKDPRCATLCQAATA
ncbi:MAG: hypothetical protein J7498_03180 [Sphingobium sp.]|nr:hypothetical protein [Sphingobium sp.]